MLGVQETLDVHCTQVTRNPGFPVLHVGDGFQPSAAGPSPWLALQASRWTLWGPRISSPIGF